MDVVTGQACSDECGKDRCNLSASDCIDGICQTAVGNTCAALGEKIVKNFAVVRYLVENKYIAADSKCVAAMRPL